MVLPADCYLVEVDLFFWGGGIQVVFGVFYRHYFFSKKFKKFKKILSGSKTR
jgi:hypothetical protein